MLKCHTGFLLLSMLWTSSAAQHFGGHPLSMQWNQINTDSIRIIFPPGFERHAQSIARYTHALPLLSGKSIGSIVRKIDIVLQPHSTISNGYVALGPRRSEFQLTPLQNSFQLGSIPWHQSLALHEYRHIQQYNNFRKGISKAFYYLFGQQGQELANNAAIPNWFWEGDAVLQETLLSTQGRGRLPYFFNGFRALHVAGKSYGWMKIRNGSLRDYTPDHYQLGYQLVAYGRKKFGETFWQSVTNDAVRFRGLFYPFQRAVKRHAGISFKQFRNEALRYFNDTGAITNFDPAHLTAARSKHFIADENFPQWIDSTYVVYVHSSYKEIPTFRIRNIRNGSETVLRTRDIALDEHFSYSNGQIVYAAFDPDNRWGWRDYSDIRLLDVATGKQHSLTQRAKYFSPAINRAGNRVVAVHAGSDGTHTLHLLTIAENEVDNRLGTERPYRKNSNDTIVRSKVDVMEVKALSNPAGYTFTYPRFFDDQRIVVALRDTLSKMAIALVNTTDGQVDLLTPAISGVIGFLNIHRDTILFSASYGTLDRMFCIAGNKIFLLRPANSSYNTGSYQPSLHDGRFAWTEFTASGSLLQIATKEFMQLEELDASAFSRHFPFNMDAQPPPNLLLNNRTFAVTRYRNTTGLVNFHSWRPTITDPEYTFSLLSENTLNTLYGEVYFTYNRNEQSSQVGFTATYAALFPWIRAGTHYTLGRQARFNGVPVYWNEWEGRAGLVVPLNLTGGRYYRNFSAGSDIVINKSYYKGALKDSFDTRAFAYLNNFILFSNQVQRSRQQIYPRWAQTVSVRYSHAVTVVKGKQLMLSADWYLPGLVLPHSLVLNTAFHLRDTFQDIRFSNSFPFSRGYMGENFHRMIKAGAEYHFPVVYPDWGFASLVYFQRIRAAFFYDHTYVSDYTGSDALFNENYRSFGTEIFFDTKWWNQEPVSFGIRYARLLDGAKQNLGNNQWELILPVNLFKE